MVVEEKYMARCIELARGGEGNTAPNPMVGAVIVHKGKIIGEGFHRKCGEAHAEVNAVASVRDEALLRDSTIYVSLEPCSHYGKTPPCAELIIRKGIPRVVVGTLDPFPEVSGRGVRMLREAGIEVVTGVLEEEAPCLESCFYDFPDTETPLCLSEMGPERRWVYGYPEGRCFCTFGAFVFSRDSPKGSSASFRSGGYYGRDTYGVVRQSVADCAALGWPFSSPGGARPDVEVAGRFASAGWRGAYARIYSCRSRKPTECRVCAD